VQKSDYDDIFTALKSSRQAVTGYNAPGAATQGQAGAAESAATLAKDIGEIQRIVDSPEFAIKGQALATRIVENGSRISNVNAGNVGKAALEVLRLRSLAPSLLGLGVDASGNGKAKTKREFSKPRGSWWQLVRSCREVQSLVDKQRRQEGTRIASYVFKGEAPQDDKGNDKDKARLVIDRRDWQTGIVISRGWYRSLENQLFDPDATDENEPQVNVAPIEFLAHSKLSSSIDIGAGLGVALFRTERPGNPEAYPKFDESNLESKSFYLVPLSVVVRPGRLFTNSRWASILGYRMSLRYFGDLDTTNFALKPPLTNQTPSYTQKGEFVWGAAAFIDGVAAVELLGELFR